MTRKLAKPGSLGISGDIVPFVVMLPMFGELAQIWKGANSKMSLLTLGESQTMKQIEVDLMTRKIESHVGTKPP
jgi:hypothetical protein